METAYLIGTNEDFISLFGRKKVAGKLRIATMEANEYSRIGSGKICFDNEREFDEFKTMKAVYQLYVVH